MNAAVASQFALTWPEFCLRGGETDIHADGWGLAYYCGQGLRQFHDVQAASTSRLANFLGQEPIETRNLLAHIRYATSGTVDLANVHPFSREYVDTTLLLLFVGAMHKPSVLHCSVPCLTLRFVVLSWL